MLRIVLDTNVLLDGSQDDYHYANRIIDLVLEGKVSAYANRSTLKENRLIVANKLKDAEYQSKLKTYFESLNYVESAIRMRVVEDSEDNKILESALAADADYLITSDHHLLVIEQYERIRIVTPEQFWNIYEDSTQQGWSEWIKTFLLR